MVLRASDGRVEFYLDGTHVYTSTQVPDYLPSGTVAVYLGYRLSYHDNVRVERIGLREPGKANPAAACLQAVSGHRNASRSAQDG